MDAVEFLKENDRMCKTFNSCSGKDGGEMCELYVKSNEKGLGCADYATTYPEETVKIIEKWAKEHPKKTRQSEFLKMFPNAFVYIGLNYWQYKQLGRKSALVLMLLMIVCCVWDIVEVVV